jgi:DNA-binding response OmpR family regulator
VADLLIVDDDQDLAAVLEAALRWRGHDVRVGCDGEEGLRLIADRRPDLVLLDVDMPVLSGPDMSWVLFLRNCGDESIPLVLLSGTLGLAHVAAVVGTPYFLPKPYSLEAVLSLVDRVLDERTPPHPRNPL